ncbi:MAG: sigma-54 dependent transcriptional regulator [Thermodesulfobacteriota bacterium]
MSNTEESKGRILVIDDEQNICESIKKTLERSGYSVSTSHDGYEALKKVRADAYDMVICDIRLPDQDGLQLLDQIKEFNHRIIVCMITGYASIDTAITSMRHGAIDYITKPFKPDQIRFIVNRAFQKKKLRDESIFLRDELGNFYGQDIVIGNSKKMHEVFELALKVSETDSSVLILGESGTGKEVLARIIHFKSFRSNNPFVTVNCAAIPEALLESELFGHKKGAFTGAIYTKKGSFELADGGTLFLDEISEMKKDMQAKILRALEARKIKRVGSEDEISVDARVVAATNKEITQEVREGNFRDDLYYRLNVVQINIPPLREQREDIPIFARHFLKRYSDELKKSIFDFSERAMARIVNYNWPGNVRELKNAIERAVIFAEKDGLIRSRHLPQHILEGTEVPAVDRETESRSGWGEKGFRTLKEVEDGYIEEVLRFCGGNRIKAAEILGISPVTIWRKFGKENTE